MISSRPLGAVWDFHSVGIFLNSVVSEFLGCQQLHSLCFMLTERLILWIAATTLNIFMLNDIVIVCRWSESFCGLTVCIAQHLQCKILIRWAKCGFLDLSSIKLAVFIEIRLQSNSLNFLCLFKMWILSSDCVLPNRTSLDKSFIKRLVRWKLICLYFTHALHTDVMMTGIRRIVANIKLHLLHHSLTLYHIEQTIFFLVKLVLRILTVKSISFGGLRVCFGVSRDFKSVPIFFTWCEFKSFFTVFSNLLWTLFAEWGSKINLTLLIIDRDCLNLKSLARLGRLFFCELIDVMMIYMHLFFYSLLQQGFVGWVLASDRVNLFQQHLVSRENFISNAHRKRRQSPLVFNFACAHFLFITEKPLMEDWAFSLFFGRWPLELLLRHLGRLEPTARLGTFWGLRHVLLSTIRRLSDVMLWSLYCSCVNAIS